MTIQKFVSLIIPTYREWHLLSSCIAALQNQTYPASMFEVIIVNNDPSDRMPEGFFLPPGYTVITEEKPGSYAARNKGLATARGEIIGFTDSDCLPDKNWISNAVEYFASHPSCSRIAGQIAIIYKSEQPTTVEVYNTLYAFPQEWLVKNTGGNITGNLFSYKHVFDKVGPFDEKLLSMGDMAWGALAQKAGYQVDYVSNVIVHHPARNMAELVKKEKRHGGGAAFIHNKHSLFSNLLNFFSDIRPRFSSIGFMFGRSKKISRRNKLLIPFMRYYLLLVRAYEKLRVQTGRKPRRA